MQILSHRGYWKTEAEKNTPDAFNRSFELGFGTETDLRDLGGDLVIAHDPPRAGAMRAKEMFTIHAKANPRLTLALNVKADGLQVMVRDLLDQFELRDAFVFDMSVPDTLQWFNAGVPVFTRHSDVEPEPPLYSEATGVWLDAFRTDWWSRDDISRHLDAGKRVCIVSPDLHKRAYEPVWERLAEWDVSKHDNVLICTDYPETAKEYFNHEN